MKILEISNEELPSKHRPFIETHARETDIKDFQVNDLHDALKELGEYRSKGQMRYLKVMQSNKDLKKVEQIKVIQKYMDREIVGFYKRMAIEKLNKMLQS